MTDKLRIPYKDYLLSVDSYREGGGNVRMRIVDLKNETVLVLGDCFSHSERPDVKEYVEDMMTLLKAEIGVPEEGVEDFEQFIRRLDAAISRAIQEAYGA